MHVKAISFFINPFKMTLYRNITAFSQNGEYLAYSSPDGCLKIWETSTSILKQEYTPSSHLSATCSSLSWGPHKQTSVCKSVLCYKFIINFNQVSRFIYLFE